MKKQAFKLNYHSFVDIITNSSTEMFMSSNVKTVELFKDLMAEKNIKRVSGIEITTYGKYCEHWDMDDKDKRFKDEDEIIIFTYSTDSGNQELYDLMNLLGFEALDL